MRTAPAEAPPPDEDPNAFLPKGAIDSADFEAAYAKRSGMSVAALRALGGRAVPCTDCSYGGCRGWSMVFERAPDGRSARR